MKFSLLIMLLLVFQNIHAEDLYTKNGKKIAKQTTEASPKDVVQNLSTKITPEPKATEGKSKYRGQEARENTKRFSRVASSSDPIRYKKIKVSPEVASDEINMWARQMSEHALFVFLGLEDPTLKQKALDTHKTLEAFRKKFNADPLNLKLMNELLPILEKEREFQIMVLKKLDSGKWIGWIFPLFINHTTLELDYFVDKLNGIKYTAEDELNFWNRINSEHAAFARDLLDQSELELKSTANEISDKFYSIPKNEKEMMIQLSLKASKELDKFHKSAQAKGSEIKSIIHPVLLEHVIREGERSIKTLESLGLHKESAQFKRIYAEQVAQYTDGEEEEENVY